MDGERKQAIFLDSDGARREGWVWIKPDRRSVSGYHIVEFGFYDGNNQVYSTKHDQTDNNVRRVTGDHDDNLPETFQVVVKGYD